jgi:hypothetical protein
MEFESCVKKKALKKGSSLCRGPVGEPGGVCLLRLLDSFSRTQRTVKVKCGGPSGTLARNRAPLS